MNQNQLNDLRKHLANWHQLLLDGLKNRHEIEVGRPISGAEWFQFLISAPQFSVALQWNSLIADIDTLIETAPDTNHVEEAFRVVGYFVQREIEDSAKGSVTGHLNQTDSEMRLEWQKLTKLLGANLGQHHFSADAVAEMRSAWRTRQALRRPKAKMKIRN
ncbi:MAG: hypothetical protein K2X47_01130 [Bdellovibrionales bacterium]|nr:hypothetical protein [Bdellovibrionales bacterium]